MKQRCARLGEGETRRWLYVSQCGPTETGKGGSTAMPHAVAGRMNQGATGVPVPSASILLWISVASAVNHISNYAGPFEIHFKEGLQCPPGTITGPPWMNMSGTLRSSRARSGMLYDGELYISELLERGHAGVKLHVAKWDSVAGWRKNFFRIDGGEMCFCMETIGKTAMDILHRHIGIPAGCPFTEGCYTIRNFSSSLLSRYEHFPVFPYGRFRGELSFYDMKSKEVRGCISGISEVVPKLKARSNTKR